MISVESDSELLKRACRGDGGASSTLVVRYHARLVSYLIRLVHSAEFAEDLAQEAFYRVLFQSCRYTEVESREGLIPLLARMAMNAASHVREHETRWEEIAVLLQAESDVDPSRPDLEVEAKEVVSKVQEALAKLPEMYRTPLTLYEMEDWTYEQIAEHIGISIGTVKSRISRGRRDLRKLLDAYWNGGRG